MQSKLALGGKVRARKISPPGPGLLWKLGNFPRLWPGLWRRVACKMLKIPTLYGQLFARLLKSNGEMVDYGLVSTRLVTTAFVDLMVDQLITETSVWGDFKFHDSGVGVTAADVANTDIETTDGESRATGTQVENAHNIYESVGTISYSTTKAITEHGLFSTAATATLMDHHVFSAINVVDGDSIEFTYDLTVSDGG